MNIIKSKLTRILNLLAAMLGVFLLLSGNVVAQITYKSVPTKGGCLVAISEPMLSAYSQSGSLQWSWSGRCVDNMAEGLGELRLDLRGRTGERTREHTETTSGYAHQGLFYGFQKRRIQIQIAGVTPIDNTLHIFCMPGRCVGGHGLGLKWSDSLLDPQLDALPERGFDWTRENISIHDSRMGSLALMKIPCGLDKQRFPACGFGVNEQNYDVYRFVHTPAQADAAKSYTYCPSPRDRNSCMSLAEKLAQPFVDSIEEFLIASLPKLTRIDGISRNAGTLLTQRRKTELALEAAAKQAVENEAIAKEAAEKEASAMAEKQFRNTLKMLNAGQLFSKADELSSSGDPLKAREVLRALVSRFPDHPLANTAAQKMSNDTSISAGAAGSRVDNANVSLPSTGAGKCWDVLAQKEKEYESINRKPVPAGATPGLKRVMWMTSDSIKVIDGLCAGDAKAAKYRGELQTAYQQAKTACEQMSVSSANCAPEAYR